MHIEQWNDQQNVPQLASLRLPDAAHNTPKISRTHSVSCLLIYHTWFDKSDNTSQLGIRAFYK